MCLLYAYLGSLLFQNDSVIDILNQNEFCSFELLPECMGKAGQTSSNQCIIQHVFHLIKPLCVFHSFSGSDSVSKFTECVLGAMMIN